MTANTRHLSAHELASIETNIAVASAHFVNHDDAVLIAFNQRRLAAISAGRIHVGFCPRHRLWEVTSLGNHTRHTTWEGAATIAFRGVRTAPVGRWPQ